ncbi:MAG: hypothetical protein M3422_05455 [Actinomycetota bacterium]|nr:hypothetical protein [Actinomycetota bacterium]
MRTVSALGLVVGISAVVSTVLFALTVVLAMTGATGACVWTGTIGAVLLAVWLVAINIRRRPVRTPTSQKTSA